MAIRRRDMDRIITIMTGRWEVVAAAAIKSTGAAMGEGITNIRRRNGRIMAISKAEEGTRNMEEGMEGKEGIRSMGVDKETIIRIREVIINLDKII